MPLPIPRFMVRASRRRAYEAHENARDHRRAERHRLDALFLDMHRQHRAAEDAARVLEARSDSNVFAPYVLEGGAVAGVGGDPEAHRTPCPSCRHQRGDYGCFNDDCLCRVCR